MVTSDLMSPWKDSGSTISEDSKAEHLSAIMWPKAPRETAPTVVNEDNVLARPSAIAWGERD